MAQKIFPLFAANEVIWQWDSIIKRLRLWETDFANPGLVPSTRSMSSGRRKLLIEWLDAQKPVA